MTRRLAVPVLLGLVVLTACAAGPNDAAPGSQPAGFWLGLWHGVILPVTFVISLFNSRVSIYEVHNVGNWYDSGFVLGLLVSLGGTAGGGRAGRRRGRAG